MLRKLYTGGKPHKTFCPLIYILSLLVICGISVFFGRVISLTLLASFIIPLLYVHAYYLPKKKEINGWTEEPKSKYYEFRNWDKAIFSKSKDEKAEKAVW